MARAGRRLNRLGGIRRNMEQTDAHATCVCGSANDAGPKERGKCSRWAVGDGEMLVTGEQAVMLAGVLERGW